MFTTVFLFFSLLMLILCNPVFEERMQMKSNVVTEYKVKWKDTHKREQKDFKGNGKERRTFVDMANKKRRHPYWMELCEKYRFCHLAATAKGKSCERTMMINGKSILQCLPVGYWPCHLGFLDSVRSLFLSLLSISSIDNEHQSN